MPESPDVSPPPPEGPSPPGAPLVLIVDDDDVVRTIMRAELEDEGFEVIEAEDGAEGLALATERLPDLAVIDVVMPRMDGYEVCQALRAAADTAFLPVLMSTGLNDDASIAKAYDAGATDFIPKPIQWTILRQRVRYMLRSGQAFQRLRRNEATLIAAKEAAEAGARAKSEFLAMMSHELRTPLNAVIGLGGVMESQALGALSPQYLEMVGMILQSGRHLLDMIEGVLDLARAEANELALDIKAVDVAEAIAKGEQAARALTSSGGMTFSSDIAPRMARMMGDEAQITRIVEALTTNAVKFSKMGATVSLDARRDAAGDLVIRVADTGIGMSPDKIALALSPFGQAQSGATRQYGGAGVGLPLTNRLVQLHGGVLDIDSAEGKGTTVTVRFPRRLFTDTAGQGEAAA